MTRERHFWGMALKNRYEVLVALAHVIVWLMLLFIPYMMFPHDTSAYWKDLPRIALSLCQYVVIFYINYFILAPRLFFERRFLPFFLINITLIAAIVFLNQEFRAFFMPNAPMPSDIPGNRGVFHPRPEPIPGFFIWKDMLSLAVPVVFSLAIQSTRNWIRTESRQKEVENKHLESELAHLRYQVQPHFFFNSLNNIYALIGTSPESAQEAVHGLGKLMRYMLYDTGHEKKPIADEISFLKNYIQLMELRQNARVKTIVEFPEFVGRSCFVAPLLFIALIENAYKHGVSATSDSLLSFRMMLDGDRLAFISENSHFPKTKADASGSGIGLDNLSKRLELIYPGRHTLKTEVDGMVFRAVLILQLNEAA